jgi:cytochrome c oxidase subunit IV
MDTHDLVSFKRHIRLYVGVFIALMIATVITVAVSYFHFGHEDSHVGNVTVALIIAGIKAALVAGFFMHLSSEKRAIYVLLVFTGLFCLVMLFLTVYGSFDTPDLTQWTQSGDGMATAPTEELGHEP